MWVARAADVVWKRFLQCERQPGEGLRSLFPSQDGEEDAFPKTCGFAAPPLMSSFLGMCSFPLRFGEKGLFFKRSLGWLGARACVVTALFAHGDTNESSSCAALGWAVFNPGGCLQRAGDRLS
ncbi:hypothetical protein AAFF_G00149950 [Aldrovandia affinis]|uniref:Uncharacterized protein n=1 Tax=Aldrovandia affinis TaxID=143900 RepID=A0AAD7RRW1_9TELE|nr:hypothetical protein AAFF_G00149950 [Aldrovandia affinis]